MYKSPLVFLLGGSILSLIGLGIPSPFNTFIVYGVIISSMATVIYLPSNVF